MMSDTLNLKPLTDENWQENVNIVWKKIEEFARADLSLNSNKLALSNAILELISARASCSEISSGTLIRSKAFDDWFYNEARSPIAPWHISFAWYVWQAAK